jgi:GNAT superfamily N-acetyltransferase
MPDMLVKLYNLHNDSSFLSDQRKIAITIRKPIGPEKHLIIDWVKDKFSAEWASEIDTAMSNRPISSFLAIKNEELIGFACYDATALGYFGPMGVEASHRQKGTGKALLMACLHDMKLKGYGYAIIGGTEACEFYEKAVGATVIADSKPGIYKTWLRKKGQIA